ncbi:MAG: hypothetical protein QF805_28215, partial [Pirellulaceae bacterium]|nr:hypothetical protein [Pirellulaceae bacterium]
MPRKPAELKQIMEKEKITWRSFVGSDDISRQWNSPPTPAFYLLDDKGVIRHKWIGHPGEYTIDGAVKKLIAEVKP